MLHIICLIFFYIAWSQTSFLRNLKKLNFEKFLEEWDIRLKNWKLFFHQKKCKIVIACSSFEKVLNSWIESYEAYSIFRTSAILEVVIFENSSFLNFLRIKSETNHFTFLNNYFVLRSPINLTWCFWQNTR